MKEWEVRRVRGIGMLGPHGKGKSWTVFRAGTRSSYVPLEVYLKSHLLKHPCGLQKHKEVPKATRVKHSLEMAFL